MPQQRFVRHFCCVWLAFCTYTLDAKATRAHSIATSSPNECNMHDIRMHVERLANLMAESTCDF